MLKRGDNGLGQRKCCFEKKHQRSFIALIIQIIGTSNNSKVFKRKVINALGRSTLIFTNYINKEHYISYINTEFI
jgi:hypothetical protein